MRQYEYRLNKEHLKEANQFTALHDRSLQKKLISLSVAIAVLLAAALLGLGGVQPWTIALSIVCALLVFALFPRLYWQIVFHRVDAAIENKEIRFPDVRVCFDKELTIHQEGSIQHIAYEDVKAVQFTRMDCLLYYKAKDRLHTLILPNETIGEELEQFIAFLQQEVIHT